jgi:hypothetical protein
MQYYLYLSQPKIEVLYSQVPRSIVKQAAIEFGIKVGWFSTNLKTDKPDVTLAIKAAAVTKFVCGHENVTKADGNGAYRFDRLPLKYGVLRDRAEGLAFFGGAFGDLRFVLIGHPHSLVGSTSDTTHEVHTVDHYVLSFLQAAADAIHPSDAFDDDFHATAIAAAANALHDIQRPAQPIEFLAKTIYDLQDNNGRTVIATPIYVSLL